MVMYSDEDGRLAVKLARAAIDYVVLDKAMPEMNLPEIFHQKSGAFVTLNTYPGHDLRGCIGYPTPHYQLFVSIIKGAEGATQDPRFPPLRGDELDRIVVEVSLLTPPELIEVSNPKEYLEKVVIGRDGVIAEKGLNRGLLLPQVPVEWEWNVEEFLAHTCNKAGLLPDAWLDGSTKIYSFRGEIFSETEPRGVAVRKVLDGS
jgi:uncharacterized protein (TIGR00296 family)